MKVYPVKYEAYDSWKEISEEILKCLIEMKLGEV